MTVKLKPKHYKALELFEEGILNIKEIAKACGINERVMYQLFEGDVERMGEIAALFKEELARITARTSVRIRELTKDTKKLGIYQLNERLRTLNQKKTKTTADTREITSILNSLAKTTSNVEIGTFSITKGMTPEEIRDEFKRLQAIARAASIRGRILPVEPGEPGQIPTDFDGGDQPPEE
jgi:hypothetical protein